MDRDSSHSVSVSVAPCSSLAVDSILRCGTAGLIWGLCSGPYVARKNGLVGFARASFVSTFAGECGFRCGLVAGLFSLTRCGIQQYRRKNDWVNAMVAGSLAGAAVAARTRNWGQIVGMATLISAFSAASDYTRSI